jgi:hypothetical protein
VKPHQHPWLQSAYVEQSSRRLRRHPSADECPDCRWKGPGYWDFDPAKVCASLPELTSEYSTWRLGGSVYELNKQTNRLTICEIGKTIPKNIQIIRETDKNIPKIIQTICEIYKTVPKHHRFAVGLHLYLCEINKPQSGRHLRHGSDCSSFTAIYESCSSCNTNISGVPWSICKCRFADLRELQ